MKKRYSHLIVPLLLLIDIFIINIVVFSISDKEYLNISFLSYINLFWLISSFSIKFYITHRYTSIYKIIKLLIIQFSLFFLGYFTYFGLFREGIIVNNQTRILSLIILAISFSKIISFYLLKKYRSKGNNYRNVVIIGYDSNSKKLIELFKNKKELGYQFIGFFDDETSKKNDYLGALIDSKKNILKKEVDEIYCSIQSLTKNQIKDFTKFANKYSKTIKLIPSATELYSKNYNATYYEDTITVLDVQKLPFDLIENRIIKRVFDIIFSTFVCIFVLSWVVPILWIIVKLDSKGPLFFKQEREGLEGNHFTCYKFRSMKSNSSTEKKHTSKNDTRVTKVGAFLRKTSVDELPQFFNALKGNMSVVGPRPHIKEESLQFEKDVANYMERKSVKPGITGLAQVSGYRGEIQKKSDIKNRVRLDVFYIENWSFFLDIKIIIQTILNVFKGDEKAY
ncbi:Probable transmembrane hypothetical protein. Putative sugar transferase involved in exopolysaccharide synthesis [Tenacibaculum maritimum]|uniref:exopolysaccharide biosynthesis polyprenyl glycosylphosphotransferase n=1 Tax=Tenacibaculum maritimum TaxID=107401 RepID=UPI0012E40420|nr:exopolysaccharide biosynthesis polyprenyl glycosylphosphotransferase [Tenacibaculum maritimum]CAA0204493.1 Probable transmembrane hypothetical protein. Putative sugar transferase involved in exopolysaccharide synthesis [Tenacibaculum maritimum]